MSVMSLSISATAIDELALDADPGADGQGVLRLVGDFRGVFVDDHWNTDGTAVSRKMARLVIGSVE